VTTYIELDVERPRVEATTPSAGKPEQRPLRVGGLSRAEVNEYAIALAAGAHIALLLRFLLDWDDLLGTTLIALISFIVIHHLIVRERTSSEVAIDKSVTTVMWTVGLAVVSVLLWMVTFVFLKGIKQLSWSFLKEDLAIVGPLDPGGGAFHAMVGTLEQVGIATIVVVPTALLTAVYLHEVRGRMAGLIRFIVDSLAALPSIIAGLLVYTLWSGYAGAHASLALFILAIPLVTRGAEEVLRTVPDGLREASLALGAPQWRMVMRVIMPTAQSGLVTVTLLAIARMVGETAPVLLTASITKATNWDPLNDNQASLSTFVFDLIRQPNQTQIDRAWAGALLLLIIVLIIFVAARVALARSERKLGKR
jgi:phosphate transport system permease protein